MPSRRNGADTWANALGQSVDLDEDGGPRSTFPSWMPQPPRPGGWTSQSIDLEEEPMPGRDRKGGQEGPEPYRPSATWTHSYLGPRGTAGVTPDYLLNALRTPYGGYR